MDEMVVDRIVREFLYSDNKKKQIKLLEAAVIVITTEKLLEEAGLGERSKIAKRIADMVATFTLPLGLYKISEEDLDEENDEEDEVDEVSLTGIAA